MPEETGPGKSLPEEAGPGKSLPEEAEGRLEGSPRRSRSHRRWPPTVVFESWIDRQIREAIERGEFDNLPGAGKPIPDLDDDDENWWIKAKLEREGIKPPLPNALALRREVEEIQRALVDVRTESGAREIIEHLNTRIRESCLRRNEGLMIIVRTLAVEPTLAQWRRRRSGSA